MDVIRQNNYSIYSEGSLLHYRFKGFAQLLNTLLFGKDWSPFLRDHGKEIGAAFDIQSAVMSHLPI